MPSAIARGARVAISPRQDRQLSIRSEQFPGHFAFDLDDLPKAGTGAWCDYVLGVAVVLREVGHPFEGVNLFIDGEFPFDGGLRSSAGIVGATALSLTGSHHSVSPSVEVASLFPRIYYAFT